MTLTATTAGTMTGYFTIPANVPAGTKRVQFYGSTSGGTYAEATFVGRGVLTTRELQETITVYTQDVWVWNGDPVAQTFTLNEDILCNGVDIQFTAKGTSNVVCSIRETSGGMPTNNSLCGALLAPAQITTNSSSGNTFTRFSWPAVKLTARREYAICLFCDDAVTAVRYAELGQFDPVNQKWVTQQAYLVGVMLTSSNATTWTPNQTRDLTFRLLRPAYSSTQSSLALSSVSVTSVDLIQIMAAVERPLTGTDCTFQVKTYPTTSTTNVYTIREGQPLLLPSQYTGKVDVTAILKGAADRSPRLHKDIQIIAGTGRTSGTYISRTIPCNATSASSSKMTVNLTARLPQGSGLEVRAQVGTDASSQPIWSTTFVQASTPVTLDNNWTDRIYTLSGFSLSETRIKITITGTAQARPEIKNLQASVVSV